MKQEFKNISHYLPYNLNVEIGGEIIREVLGYIITPDGEIKIWARDLIGDKRGRYSISCIKPVLHPLSDLTNEININGKKLIPLLELARIAYPSGENWYLSNETACCEGCEGDINFYYSENSFCLECRGFGCYGTTDLLEIKNQLQLFEKLYEWHVDVYNLIEKELAIDINKINL